MKGTITLLLCAVALAQGFHQNPVQRSSEAHQICQATYDSDNVLVAHENCNQFYKCNHGKPVAFKCYGNLRYNPYTEQCDWPVNVDCGDRVIPEQRVSVPSVVDPLGGSPDNICPVWGVPRFLVPHENCNQFYRCVFNVPVLFTCPDGLLYDPTKGICDWPSDVDCGDRVIPDPNQSVTNPPGTTPEATIPGNNGNPSEAPAICAAVGSDGVLVAHEKCNQFYKCSEGKPVAFLCPDGLLFNPAKDQCDWPVNVDCGDRVIPDKSVSVPSVIDPLGTSPINICAPSDVPKFLLPHENCNQFYMCVINAPVVFTCPEGLLFDLVEGQCDWPSNVDCGDRVIPNPDQSVTYPPGTTPEATIPGNNGNPSEAPAICAADGSDGVLVAHEKCNQFYKCSEGKPVAFLCPDGLLFNSAKDQCDWPVNVDCGFRVIPDQNVSVPSVIDPLGTSPDNICAPSDVPKFLLPHENCNQFYMCVINAPVVFTCPEGLLFDPVEGQCDWPSNVDCGDRVIPDPDQSVTYPPGTTPEATIPGNNGNPSEAPAICAADDSDGVLVAHEKCNQFYKCSEGKPVGLLCPSGLLFNPANDQCDWPFNVDCGDRLIQDPDQSVTNPAVTNQPGTNPGASNPGNNCNPSEAPAICSADGSDGVLVAHEKCNQFYKCSEGKPVALLCPSGLLFNPANDQCDWPFNVECGDRVIPSPDQSVTNPAVTNPPVTNPPATTPGATNPGNNCNPSEAPAICAADSSDGVLVAHEKCNQFYKCSEGKPVALLCPSGLLFNPAKDQCDWPFNVDCGDRVIPSPDQIATTPGVINPPVTNQPATTPGATNPGNNCNPSEAPAICAADGSDGVLVAHEKCNQFYKCSEGKPVALLCPSGLLFNPAKDQCDWPFNVDCGDRVIPSPDQIATTPGVINPPVTNPPATTPGAINPGNNCNPSEAPAICAADGSDGVLVAHEKCNQFYKCSEGKPVALLCPSGLLFNPAKDQCDWPFNVDCGDRVIPSPDQIATTPGVINPPVTNPPATTPGAINPGNNCNPSEAPAICAADGSDGVLVAHEKCNQFYKCSEGKPVALLCPSGLLFNPAKDQCDWPFNVDCGDRVIPSPDQSVTNPAVTNPPATTPGATNPGNNCNPSEAPAICAADGSDGVLVAHEKCNQFYKCSEGKPVALLCPSGLLFNPAKDQCDWPFNVDCGDRVIPSPDQIATTPGVINPPVTNPPATTPGAINPGNNCNPSEAPAICAADGSDGVLVAHEKCNQFYKCSEGKPVALLCPSGLLFNPAKDQCDWPFNVDCGDRVIPSPDQSVTNPAVTNPPGTTPGATNPGNNCNPSEAPAICAADGSDGVLVAHEKCNQFYKCSEGKPVALLCPSGLLFNPAKDQCDWPFNVDCGDRVIPSPDQIATTPGVINPPVTNPPATTPGAINPGNNCNPSEAPAICAADGSDGVLVAHEKCNQFYKCSEGKPVALLCPSGLLFNPAKDQCDWPFNVDCGDRVIPSPDQSVTNPAVTNPPATTPGATNPGNNCNPSEAPAICAADGSDGVLVAHEKCNQFYKCSEGKPVALLCPSGLLFNPAKDQCDWPFNVDCGDRVIPSPDQIATTPGVINPPVTNPPATTPGAINPGNNCNPSEAPAICAADGSDGVLVAHEKCNQFYKCSEGKPVALLCPSGLLFNPAKDQCDWPFNVDCGDRVIPSPDQSVTNPAVTNPPGTTPGATNPGNNCNPSEAPAICAADGSDGVLVAHEKCNQFYKCSEGKPVALLCPSGLLFNPAKDQCDWPFNVDCGDRVIPSPDQIATTAGVINPPVTNPPATTPGAINPGNNCNPSEAPAICAADGSDGVLVAHEKCNQFYKCSEGKPVALLCPSGLLFNPAKDQCDWPFNVDCGDRVIPSPDQSVTNPAVTNPPGTTPGATNLGNNCNPSEAPAICAADGSDGVLVAHEKCNQFYKCSEGKPVALLCPSGLLFNPAKDQCDWPFNVDCGDRVIPDPDQSVTNPPGTTPEATIPGNNGNPSEAPAICAADGSDGVLVAHEKCNQFYKCSEGKPVALLCPSGLLFNPAKDQCDWPFNVECGDRVIPSPDQSVLNPAVTNQPGPNTGASNPGNNGNPSEAPAICAADGSDGVLVAHEKCNQFYKCSEGKPVALLCPSGLLFNPANDQCDWPFNVNCGDRVIPDPDQSVTNPPGTTPEATIPGNNGNPSEAPAICAADGSDGVLVAHEKCNQFYKCSEGKPVALLCPSGLLFNPAKDQCDWPFNVECGDRVIPSLDQSVLNPAVTNQPGTNTGASNSGNNGNPSEAPAICAADGSDGVLVAHEKCNQFYKCSEGKPVALLCPSGLLFNPANDQCDWPFNVNCGDRVIPDPDQSVTNPPGTTPEATIPGNNGNPSEAPAICAADGSDGVLVAHEKCNQFYKCSEGKPVALLCPSGLLFNPAKDQCDWPFNVECGDRVIPSLDQSVLNPAVTNQPGTNTGASNSGNNGNPSEAPAICAADGSDGVLVAHEKCNQFYKCSEGKPVALLCPSGLLFNPANDQCDWPFNVNCGDRVIPDPDQSVTNPPGTTPEATIPGNNGNPSEAPAICAADGSDGVLVAHEKCNQFYKCSEGKPVALLCPSGLLFNPAKDQCDWPFNVECGDRVIPSPDQSVLNPAVTNQPGTNTGASNPGNNGNPSEAPAICAADGSDGVLVAHEKCNQFYKCSEGKPVALLCPSGLLFNPANDQCDWPFNVNCGDRVIPDPDQSVTNPPGTTPEATIPGNNGNPSEAPAICAADGSDGVLVAHEKCNQFYKCSEGKPVALLCPSGLLFNPAKDQCDWPFNVECGDRVIPSLDQSVLNPAVTNQPGTNTGASNPGNNGNPSEAPAICAADGSDGVLVAHEKCNQFYKCSEGKPVALLCPSGLLFNPANDQCDWPFNVNCGDRVIPDPDQSVTNPPGTTPEATIPGNNGNPSEAPAICAADGSDGVLVAHEKCNQFYKCSEGKPVALLCPSGLLFNPANDQCDWPFNVECGDRVIPSPDQSVLNPAVTNQPGTNPGASNPGNNGNPSEAPAICAADGSDGVLVAHEKCNQFYKCSEGKPVALLCPSGLLFNPANDQCDWPFNVNCGDRVIPDPDQSVTNPPGTTPGATIPGNNGNPSEAPAICAADGSDGVLVAHEKCNQFYKCSEGKPVALLCPSGLLFNPANDQCDWPWNVECGDRIYF